MHRKFGHNYFGKHDTGRFQRRLIARLESLGLRAGAKSLIQAA